jgi:murein DD-endopeptidase MepM/ murein hydrolase activator NlpD
MTTRPATYQVKQGETYYSIGKKLGISADSLVAANPSLKPTELRPGATIQLVKTAVSAAVEPAKSEAAKSETAKAAVKPETPKTETPKPVAKSAVTSPSSTGSSKVSKAALQTTAATPVSASHGTSPAVTEPPSPPPSPPADAAPVATASNPGIRSITTDGTTTYGEFATKHGTTVDRLNHLNALDLVETTVLAKGSELYVPAQP